MEIGHILAIDVVGYSKLLIHEQSELQQRLNENVRSTRQFRAADEEGKLIRLPTGDGMVLDVDRAARALTDSALHHRIRFADVRRAAIRRFKFYGIYYTVRENDVWILAIFHGRKHPRALQERTRRIE